MKFDYTNGKKARYMTSAYGWNIEDHYYFHYYRDAKAMLAKLVKEADPDTIVSVYDIGADVRKDFVRA